MNQRASKNVVFFIGAGFTKAIVDTAPTGTEFFSKAFNPAESFIQDERIKNVRNFIEKIYYTIPNPINEKNCPKIEDVLSLFDYLLQRKESLSRDYPLEKIYDIRNDLIYLIGKIIKDSLENSSARIYILEGFSSHFFNLKNKGFNISIISTNYDIILDNILQREQNCNYGAHLRKSIDLKGTKMALDIMPDKKWDFIKVMQKNPPYGSQEDINMGDIPLIKSLS